MNAPFSNKEFRNTLGQFSTGVTVMTTIAPCGQKIGLTVCSFNSLSVEPPLILWSLQNNSSHIAAFQLNDPFVINILSDSNKNLVMHFFGKKNDYFTDCDHHLSEHDIPILAGNGATLECKVEQRITAGDHDIIIGRVLTYENHSKPPVVFHNGKLHTIGSKI